MDVWTLYAASIATGFGIAIMQPGMPTLVREWLPHRIGLGTVVYSNGMVVGAILPPVLTIPLILPLAGGSWRLDFFVWAVPAILIALVFFLLSPKQATASGGGDRGRPIVVAGLEESADLAARADFRLQQQSLFRGECFSWRLSGQPGPGRICWGRRWPR